MLREIAPKTVVDSSFVKEIARTRKNVTIADAVAARIIYQAVIKGDSWALRELLDRTEGRSKESVTITTTHDLNAVACVVSEWLDNARDLNKKYSVPMSTEDEIRETIHRYSEASGVSESELAELVQVPVLD